MFQGIPEAICHGIRGERKGAVMIGALKWALRIVGGLIVGLAVVASGYLAAGEGGRGEDSKYIGAAKCRNCHRSTRAGNQYGTWQKMKHTKAWETLGSDEAKKIAREKGVDDPQKSEKCLKCHVTAFGEPAGRVARKFDTKLGVQCESCHGAGEKHFKDRLAAAGGEEEDQGDAEKPYVKIPEGEVVEPHLDVCLKCHNSESPTFKSLCITEIFKEVMHFDPRKKRSDADVEAMKKKITDELIAKNVYCGGSEKCRKCKKAAGK